MITISLIIPVYRDTQSLAALLPSLAGCGAEVIVAGAIDERAEVADVVARAPGVRAAYARPGRAGQMNAAAAAASGDWLLFLHADTQLPAGWRAAVEDASRDPRVVIGCFGFELESHALFARAIEAGVRWRVRWFALPYGDQALFVRAATFREIGGYADVRIMEDVDLVRRMRARGRLYRSHLPARTSARRWEAQGWLRRTALNLFLIALYATGVAPGHIEKIARRKPAG